MPSTKNAKTNKDLIEWWISEMRKSISSAVEKAKTSTPSINAKTNRELISSATENPSIQNAKTNRYLIKTGTPSITNVKTGTPSIKNVKAGTGNASTSTGTAKTGTNTGTAKTSTATTGTPSTKNAKTNIELTSSSTGIDPAKTGTSTATTGTPSIKHAKTNRDLNEWYLSQMAKGKEDGIKPSYTSNDEMNKQKQTDSFNAYANAVTAGNDKILANAEQYNQSLANATQAQVDSAQKTLDANLASIEAQKQNALRESAITYERMQKYLPNYLKASGLSGQGISENALIRMGSDYANQRYNASESARNAETAQRTAYDTSVSEYLANLIKAQAENTYNARETVRSREDALANERYKFDESMRQKQYEQDVANQEARATSLSSYIENMYNNATVDADGNTSALDQEEYQNIVDYYNRYKSSLSKEQQATIEQQIESYGEQMGSTNIENLANGYDFTGSDGGVYRIEDQTPYSIDDYVASKIGNTNNYQAKTALTDRFKKTALESITRQGYSSFKDASIADGTVVTGTYGEKQVTLVYYGGAWYEVEKVK